MAQTPPPTPESFRSAAQAAFAFLAREFDFREVPLPSSGFHNPVAVWFESPVVRVVIDGTGWGIGARVALGRAAPGVFENYDLGDLLAERGAPPVALGGQLEQLPRLADALRAIGADILRGDVAIFPALQARVERRAAEFAAVRDPRLAARGLP